VADVRPFKGIRYGDHVVLDDVVSPPYDVISTAQAATLRERSPHNAVYVDLPVAPGEAAEDACYARSAALFREWRTEGVLRRDEEPALYALEQTYVGPDGRQRTRRGFVARMRLAALDEGVVRPHERTHAGPKVDRLSLYRHTHADLSQIFLLFPDGDGAVAAELAAAAEPAGAVRQARDADGNVHRVTRVTGRRAERIAAVLADRPVYIADGHHRYETALAYRDERRAAGDHSADTLMVYLCSLEDPGLMVFPTHRLVKGFVPPPPDEVVERLRPHFELIGEPLRGLEASAAAFEALPEQADPGRVFGLYLVRDQAGLLIRARHDAATESLLSAGHSPETAALSVNVLHDLVFAGALGMDPGDEERQVDYVKNVPDAAAALAGGGYELGAFLNATGVDQVRAVADAGETMPQKSTYFYPKLLTGLVFDELG
jgi:uncharacterized protein (DUF1015 family)